MHSTLDHEKLDVYQQSLQLIAWTVALLDKTAPHRVGSESTRPRVNLNSAEHRRGKRQVYFG
jgi:hypothetical protein